MITCPWCGTNYTEFQSNCKNCGGSLPLPVENIPTPTTEPLLSPPLPPRVIPRNIIWRILLIDGWAITGLVFLILGIVFGIVGFALTITVVAIFVGLPFTVLGFVFLGSAIGLLIWRYQIAEKTLNILKNGSASLGKIADVYQNFYVQVNGRYPWTIEFNYDVDGKTYDGKVTTLSRPDLSQQPGRPVYVLYLLDDPAQNTIYPSPYGFFSI